MSVSDAITESWARRELRCLLSAVQYFTRVPVPVWVGHSPRQLALAARYLPLVGVAVGAIGAATLWLGALMLNPVIGVLLSTVVTIGLTGAFHEDGLADTFDSLGTLSRQRALEIMKDSRVGTFGALALILVVGLKVAVLAALPVPDAMLALIAGHGLSRACAVLLAWRFAYVRADESSRAKPVVEELQGADVFVAYLFGLAPLLLLDARAAVGLVATLLCSLTMRRFARHRFGGYTGDILGATQQLCEITFYLSLLAAWKWL